jgi:hypothetical protein
VVADGVSVPNREKEDDEGEEEGEDWMRKKQLSARIRLPTLA